MTDTLDPHQENGARALARRGASGCWDEPGLGKTPLSVRWLDLRQGQTAYVLTTASHVYSYAAEIEKWQGLHRSVAVDDPRADVCVTTAGRVAKWGDPNALPKKHGIIIDEAHYLKEPDSQRTRAVYGEGCGPGQGLVSRVTNGALLMSGSITPNYATELWTHLHRFWPKLIRTGQGRTMTHDQFAQRYTAGQRDPRTGKWKPRYNRRTDELRALLDRISIHRTHASIGANLMPALINRVPLAASLNEHLERDKTVRDELEAELVSVSRWIMAGRNTGKSDAALLAELVDGANIHTATLRRLLGQTKARRAAQYVDDLLRGGTAKVAVFGVHTSVLEAIRADLIQHRPAMITGSTPKSVRPGQVDLFQTNPQCRVFIGNTQAAGEAITLTAAHHMVLVESTWTPKDDAQVIARLRRRGQTKRVLADYLIVPCAIEELVYGVNRRKLSGNTALWG